MLEVPTAPILSGLVFCLVFPNLGNWRITYRWQTCRPEIRFYTPPLRNAFRWGPYWLDVGLETLVDRGPAPPGDQPVDPKSASGNQDRRDCVLLDRQPAFYFGTSRYTRLRKLQHQVLSHLGWNVRHVRYILLGLGSLIEIL